MLNYVLMVNIKIYLRIVVSHAIKIANLVVVVMKINVLVVYKIYIIINIREIAWFHVRVKMDIMVIYQFYLAKNVIELVCHVQVQRMKIVKAAIKQVKIHTIQNNYKPAQVIVEVNTIRINILAYVATKHVLHVTEVKILIVNPV